MEKLEIRNEIKVRCSADKLWDVLTNPQQTKKYMFGCETVSDWKPGSSLLWQAEYEGNKMVFVKGHVLEIKPGQLLSYTTFDPNNPAIPDVPENYLTVTYELTPGDGQTMLVVTQGDYNQVADGKRRYEESWNGGTGWMPVLEKMKEVAEN